MSSKSYPSILSSDDKLLHQYYDDYLQLDYDNPVQVQAVCSNYANRVCTIFHHSICVHIRHKLKNNPKLCSETIRQETFLRFITSVRTRKPVEKRRIERSLLAFLKNIADCTITDSWRKIYRRKGSFQPQDALQLEGEVMDPATSNWSEIPFQTDEFSLTEARCKEIFQGICFLLDNLTPGSKEILRLRLVKKMLPEDIAEEMGMKPKSVNQAIRRISKKLAGKGIDRNNFLDKF